MERYALSINIAAKRAVNRYGAYFDRDDLRQEIRVAALQLKIDESRSNEEIFRYISTRLRFAAISFVRESTKWRRVGKDRPKFCSLEGNKKKNGRGIFMDPSADVWAKEFATGRKRDKFLESVAIVAERTRKERRSAESAAVYLYFRKGLNQRETGDTLGVSEASVSVWLNRYLKDLKNALVAEGLAPSSARSATKIRVNRFIEKRRRLK